jgi:hypothetical protein
MIKKSLLLTLLLALLVPWAAFGQETLTVHDGTTTNQVIPAYIYYYDDYTRSQFVVPATELADMNGGTINAVKFYTSSTNVPYTTVSTVDVYLMEVGYTTMTALEPKENGTIVYQGTLDVVTEGSGGSLTIEFSTPYTYSGGNLLVGIENTTDVNYKNISFYGETVTDASWGGSNSSSLSGVTGSQRDFIPKTTFTYEAAQQGDCPKPSQLQANNITAHSAVLTWEGPSDFYYWQYKKAASEDWEDGGTVGEKTYTLTGLDAETAYIFAVASDCDPEVSGYREITFTTTIACPAPTELAAALTQGNGSIATLSWTSSASAWVVAYKTADDEEFTEVNVTENPYTLTGLTPETAYTAKVKAVCGGEDGESQWSSTVTFTPTDAYTLTVNDGTTTNSYVPVYGTWVDSYTKCQFIIPASELVDMQYGNINKMTFYSSTANKTWGAAEFDILLTEVNNTTFESATLVDWADMDQVYHGAVSISDYKMEIVFDNDYQYMGGNLLVGFHQTVKGTYGGISWYGVSSTNSAIGGYESSAKALSLQSFLPKTTFDYVPGEPPACPKPANLAVNYEGGITATVTWEGTATSYNIDVNGTVIEGVTSPYTLEGLELATTYTVMVQANCGEDLSDWTNAASFTTDLCMPENMCEITLELIDDYGDGWNGNYLQVVDLATNNVLGEFTNQNLNGTTGYGTNEVNTFTLAVCDGREIKFVYVLGSGSNTYPAENFFTIYDVNGEVICQYEKSETGPAGFEYTYTVNCTIITCHKPTNVTVVPTSNTATLSWNGTNDSYQVQYRTPETTQFVSPEGSYFDNFENGLGNWTLIDADGDGFNWALASETFSGFTPHGGSDMVVSASYDFQASSALTPDNYLVTPQVELGKTLTFWACGQDNQYPAEHFGVAVSTTVNDDPAAFTTVQEWTMTAKSMGGKTANTRSGNRDMGTWYQYTVDLSAYSGMGYIAIRHFGCTDMFYLDVDDFQYGTAPETVITPASEWMTIETNNPEVLIAGLEPETTYEYQVRGYCTDEDTWTDWTNMATFTTPVYNEIVWNVTEEWPEGEAPVQGEDVTIPANATVVIPDGCVAVADEITIEEGGQIIIESGGQLFHSNEIPVTVQLDINGSSSGAKEIVPEWHLIASPINESVSVASTGLVSDEFVYDLYYFDQAGDEMGYEWINYYQGPGLDPGFTELYIKKGYLYHCDTVMHAEFIGSTLPTNAPVSVELDYVEGKELTGWNLVGNPFTTLVEVDRNFYTLNATGDEIITATNNTVEVTEGIFVEALGAGETVTFTPVVYEITGEIGGGTVGPELGNLVLNLTHSNALLDRAIVRFDEGRNLSKFQLNPNHTKVYISMDNKDYAVVHSESVGELPVSFKAESNGTYNMSFAAEKVSFNYLHLIDNMTGADVDLLVNPSYSFDAKTTDYASRFKLVFATGDNSNEDNFAFFSNGNFVINNDGEATLQVVDVMGRIIKSETINGSASVSVNAATGVYMLRLINGNDVKVQKVVVR